MRHRLIASCVLATAWLAPAAHAAVRVLIVAGQSNAVGRGSNAGELPDSLRAPREDIRFCYEEGPLEAAWDPARLIRSDTLVALAYQSDSSGATFGGLVDGFGPELQLGWRVQDVTSDTVVVVKVAIGGTSLATDWDPATAGSLFHRMAATADLALAQLAAGAHPGRVRGFFWMQGERDAQDPEWAAEYPAHLAALIARVRARFGEPGMPFVLGRLNASIASTCCDSFPFVSAVRAAQEAVASSVPLVSLVDTDDLPLNPERVHFTAAGQLGLGQRFAEAYLARDPASPGIDAGAARISAWPNPAGRSVRFRLEDGTLLPEGARLSLYDLAGRRRARLDPVARSGAVEWRLDTNMEAHLTPGVYFARVDGRSSIARTMLILR